MCSGTERGLAVLTIHSCWAETSAQLLWSQWGCVNCVPANHLTRGFLSQSIHNCPSVTWVTSRGSPWPEVSAEEMQGVQVSAGSSWGQPETPCPAKMRNRNKRKQSLGGLKLAAKPQHRPWTAGPSLTPPAALSLTLPCRQLSNNFIQEPPPRTPFSKLGWLCKDQQDCRMGRASCCHLFLPSGRPGDLLCRAGSLPGVQVRGSHCRRKGNPEPQQVLNTSPLHLWRRKANAEKLEVQSVCCLLDTDDPAQRSISWNVPPPPDKYKEQENLVCSSSSPALKPLFRDNHLYLFPLVKAILKIHTHNIWCLFGALALQKGAFWEITTLALFPAITLLSPFYFQ